MLSAWYRFRIQFYFYCFPHWSNQGRPIRVRKNIVIVLNIHSKIEIVKRKEIAVLICWILSLNFIISTDVFLGAYECFKKNSYHIDLTMKNSLLILYVTQSSLRSKITWMSNVFTVTIIIYSWTESFSLPSCRCNWHSTKDFAVD